MSNKFVIVRSAGDYSDRSETSVLIVSTEETAKLKLKELEQSEALYLAKEKLINKFEWTLDDEAPVFDQERPIFNHTATDQKKEQRTHQSNLINYQAAYNKWIDEVYTSWVKELENKIDDYEKSIDESTLVPENLYDHSISFSYQEVEYLDE